VCPRGDLFLKKSTGRKGALLGGGLLSDRDLVRLENPRKIEIRNLPIYEGEDVFKEKETISQKSGTHRNLPKDISAGKESPKRVLSCQGRALELGEANTPNFLFLKKNPL